ncbi:MAG: putative two-component histidine kinase [Erysipelotrichaceae bacterium]|nr:MAG: putative two-component histidine kinase [Erysipelotrichaceae bacterium]
MKSGITRKLVTYFILVILSFAVTIAIIFSFSYRRQTKETIKTSLLHESLMIVELMEEKQTLNLSREEISSILSSMSLEDVQVWVVDPLGRISKLTPTKMGMGMMRDYSAFASATRNTIDKVLAGQQISSESLRGVFNQDTLTIGSPVYINENIVGAVFISASSNAISSISNIAVRQMLMATLIGILIASLMGYFLSKHFIKPVQAANHAIDTLASGQYNLALSKTSNDELGQLSDNLNILSSRLAKSKTQSDNLEKMRQNFISDITHELRTPVTIIRGLAEGVKDGLYEDPIAVSEQIITETQAMQRLIKDLLELSKLEDPDFNIDKQPIEVHDLLSDTCRSVQPLLETKKIKLSCETQEGLWRIEADHQRLRQMLMIVLDNAVKFSPIGSTLTLKAHQEGNKVILSIVDQGDGINEAQLKTLFVRYHTTEGNGIGLALCKRIADRHKIQIEVNSEIHKGTHFSFIIPLA